MDWKEYIETVLPEKEDRETLRRFSRAVLKNRKPDKMLCLFGAGLNGKSTILRVLDIASFDIARKPNVVLPGGQAMDFDATSIMGRIVGTPLFTVGVMEMSSSLFAFLKSLFGGDKMAARVPYRREQTHTVSFDGGIAIELNRMPDVFWSEAMRARMDIIHPKHVPSFRGQDFLGDPAFVDTFREWALSGEGDMIELKVQAISLPHSVLAGDRL
jgi:hypothetical protein